MYIYIHIEGYLLVYLGDFALGLYDVHMQVSACFDIMMDEHAQTG